MPPQRENDEGGFFEGLGLMLRGLIAAAQQATFAVGLGSAGLGATLLAFKTHPDSAKALIGLGAFFTLARLGMLIDVATDRKLKSARRRRALRHDRTVGGGSANGIRPHAIAIHTDEAKRIEPISAADLAQ